MMFPRQPADLNADGSCNARDIDALRDMINTGGTDPDFDVNGDGSLDSDDWDHMIHDISGTEFGDADLNHIVDAPDLAWMRLNFGKTGGWAVGNFTLADYSIDAGDLALVRRNFGFTGSGVTPEQMSLFILGVPAVLAGRRR